MIHALRVGATGCTSARTTTPPGSGSPPPSSARSSGRRPREGRGAGRRGRHRRPGVGRLVERAAGGRGTTSTPRGRCTPAGAARARAWALPGLGPAPGPAADPVPRHVRVLPPGLPDAAAARLRGYLGGVEGTVLDEPATAKALAGFLRRGVHCGALTADEVIGPDGRASVHARRPCPATGRLSRARCGPGDLRPHTGRRRARSRPSLSMADGRVVAVEPPGTAAEAGQRIALTDDEVLLPGAWSTPTSTSTNPAAPSGRSSPPRPRAAAACRSRRSPSTGIRLRTS